MSGCGKDIEQIVPSRFHVKRVPATCGQTGYYGYPLFCDECAKRPENNKDWKYEAAMNGEAWDEDDY